MGDTYRLVITGKQTNGTYAIIDMLVPPGAGPRPHEHPDLHESFYVLECQVLIQFEDQSFIAKKSYFVNIPMGGGVHRFQIVSSTTARLWCTVVPTGLDDFFLEIGTPVPPGTFLPSPKIGPEEQKQLQATAEKYGQKLYHPDYFNQAK